MGRRRDFLSGRPRARSSAAGLPSGRLARADEPPAMPRTHGRHAFTVAAALPRERDAFAGAEADAHARQAGAAAPLTSRHRQLLTQRRPSRAGLLERVKCA